MNLTAVQVLDIMPLLVAFGFGFLARLAHLPPLLGFLASGFLLGAMGFQSSAGLDKISDVGVTLLLFTIGLKLDLKQLFKPSIWAVSSLHMLILTALGCCALMAAATLGLSAFGALSWQSALLIAFGLSFSSTVFAVKVFDASGEMGSTHGKVAIGILIMQDLFAVSMMTISAGKVPSPWAFSLLLLIPLRPVMIWILERAGHGEMLVLTGWLLPLGGAAMFETLGIKADLGALILGVLLAKTSKADELSKALYSFKDLFLVGFFISIGLTGSLTLEAFWAALCLLVLLPLKGLFFFALFCAFKLRARSSALASLALLNYSEFGLIVVAAGQASGLLPEGWLVPMALALSLSFVISAPLNRAGKFIYSQWHDHLVKWETKQRLEGDEIVDTGGSKIIIFGMGRIGKAVYEDLVEHLGPVVVGIERDERRVMSHREAGRNVLLGDATDLDYWSRKKTGENLETILLTFPDQHANLSTAKLIREHGITARLASIATYDDHIDVLKDRGVDGAYNLYSEAGRGFAEHVLANYYPEALLASSGEVEAWHQQL